jgi:hypothetical protein
MHFKHLTPTPGDFVQFLSHPNAGMYPRPPAPPRTVTSSRFLRGDTKRCQLSDYIPVFNEQADDFINRQKTSPYVGHTFFQLPDKMTVTHSVDHFPSFFIKPVQYCILYIKIHLSVKVS